MTPDDWAVLRTILAGCAVMPEAHERVTLTIELLTKEFTFQRIHYPLPGGTRTP